MPDQEKNCSICVHTKICPFASQMEATVLEYQQLFFSREEMLGKFMTWLSQGIAECCDNHLGVDRLVPDESQNIWKKSEK